MDLLKSIYVSIPTISSLTCGILFALAFRQELTKTERHIKKILSFYFIFMSFEWLYISIYTFYDDTLKYFIPFIIFIFQIAEVTFYNFIKILTPLERNEDKHIKFHYIMPLILLLSSVVFIFSFFYTDLLSYDFISTLFFPYASLLLIFYTVFYTIIIGKRIFLYKKETIQKYDEKKWKSMQWLELVLLLRAIFVILFLSRTLVYQVQMYSLEKYMYRLMTVLASAQYIIIVYYMLMRNYAIPPSGILAPPKGTDITNEYYQPNDDKIIPESPPLNKVEFERYYETQKPYLNHSFKIAELAEYFKTNRSYMSKFINNTYEVNFSQYNNLWRLREMDYLLTLPDYANKNRDELSLLAGFSNPRSYWRVKKWERETKMNDKNN
ncbi:hypothetical protein VO54_03673 [Elizabethkingia miricola]|nr:hypothetical protein VO54_03673 [Elizabethkingia miricola]